MPARTWVLALGCALAMVLGLAAVPPAGTAEAAERATARAAARTGTVVVVLKTPAGVPGTVALAKDGTTRLATKAPTGTSSTVRVKLPVGRWTVRPRVVTDDSALYTGSASVGSLRIRAGERSTVTVTYKRAPSIDELRVERLDRTGVGLSWTAPSPDAEYAVRMATGSDVPTTVTGGTAVPVTGTTAAAPTDPASTYSFSVFARRPGTTRWWGPVSTTVTTPDPSPTEASTATVSTPGSVVTEPGEVTTRVVAGGVRASVPSGTTPTLGQAWVLQPSGSLPGGFVGVVDQVAADGSVVLRPGGLMDAFDYAEIRVPDLRGLDLQPVPGAAAPARARRIGMECGGSGSESIVVDPSMDPFGSFEATLKKFDNWGPDLPKGVSFDVEVGVDVDLAADVDLEVGASCSLDLPPLVATLPTAPVPLVMMTEPQVAAGVNGTVKLSNVGFTTSLGASVKGYVGIGDDDVDGDITATATPRKAVVDTVEGSLTFTAGVSVSVGPGLGNPTAGAMVGLGAELNALDASITTKGGVGCLELSANRSASIYLEAKAWLGDWDFARTVTVPGLEASDPYGGSPWHMPSGCGGDAQYRIASGTLDVSYDWSGGCSGDNGSCSDGPDYSSTLTHSESSDAHLVVHEPGEWASQWDANPAYLSAPMHFTGWSYSAGYRWRQSGGGCTWTDDYRTSGAVEFGSALWQTDALVTPGPDGIDVEIDDWWGDEDAEQWHDGWWGYLGAWDTDYGNGFPRVPTTYSWSGGGADCDPWSDSSTEDRELYYLGPGHWWPSPDQQRRSGREVTSTPIGECTPEACSYQVTGTDTYQYRSSYDVGGTLSSGTATVDFSFVVERKPPDAG